MTLWILVALTPFKAKAKLQIPEHYCSPGEEILYSTKGCLDNQVFIDQADDCLDRLRAQISKSTAGMKAAFSQDATSRQKGKFNASAIDYAAASATLTDLISLTDQVQDEVDSYADFVNLPEDTMNDEATGGDPESYVAKFPCYSETRQSLDSVQDDLDQVMADLKKTKMVADAAAANSSTSAARLDQSGSMGNGQIQNGVGAGAGHGVKGRSANPGSDITGVKQDEQKANSQ